MKSMQSLEFTSIPSSEAEEATRMVRRSGRSRIIPVLTGSALLVSVILYLLVVWREGSSATSSSVGGNIDTDNETNHLEDPKSPSCDFYYDCQTDRLGNKTPLSSGQAICNHQYRFGLTSDGIFQWHDCDSNEIRIIAAVDNVQSFQLNEDGTFHLFGMDHNNLLWEKPSTKKIHFTAECLSHPLLDCPYLHLHKSGDVVLNWIDDSGKWMARNIQRSYEDLFD